MSVNDHRKCAKCGKTRAEDEAVTYHRFPYPGKTNITKALAWAKYCWPEEDWTSEQTLESLHKSNKVLCGRHFSSSQFYDNLRQKLSRFAVPDEKVMVELLGNKDNIYTENDEPEESTQNTDEHTNAVTLDEHVFCKPEGLFSWQKEDTEIPCVDDDEARVPLSTTLDGEVTSQVEEYRRCTECHQLITGMRFVCLNCAECELCPPCELQGCHAQHFVLRAPEGATHKCVEAMAEAARRALAQAQVLVPEDLEIKSEGEDQSEAVHTEEPSEDPIAFSRAASVAETHALHNNTESVAETSDDEESYVPESESECSDSTAGSARGGGGAARRRRRDHGAFQLSLTTDGSGKFLTTIRPADRSEYFTRRKRKRSHTESDAVPAPATEDAFSDGGDDNMHLQPDALSRVEPDSRTNCLYTANDITIIHPNNVDIES